MTDFLKIKLDLKEPLNLLFENDRPDYYLTKSGFNLIKLVRRAAYPTTFFKTEGNHLRLGYGDCQENMANEYLVISYQDNSLKIKRDIFSTLPIFYSFIDGRFILSNDYKWVVENTASLTLNKNHLLNLLMPNPDYHDCLFDEIKILEPQTNLLVTGKGLELNYYKVDLSVEKSEPKQFLEVLEKSLDEFYESRINNQKVAFEVSGGIDSSLLPLYLKDRLKGSAYLASMIFNDDFKRSQEPKLELLKEWTNLSLISTMLDKNETWPLSRFSQKPDYFYSYSEIYFECLDSLAAKLEKLGVEVVSTGLGGDELMEGTSGNAELTAIGEDEKKRRQKADRPPFFTNRFLSEYVESTPVSLNYRLPYLPLSLISSQIARNNVYINRGIWPISPFANPYLVAFCWSLDDRFRVNKNILKSYYLAKDWPEIIYNPEINEHFGNFFNQSMTSLSSKKMLVKYLENLEKPLANYVISKEALDYVLQSNSNDQKSTTYFFNLLGFLTASINLDYYANHSRV